MDEGIARMGQVIFSSPDLTDLRVLGLGSCIGLCVYEPTVKLGCVAHIVLPEAKSANTSEVGKYADTAVPYVVKQMIAKGANQSRMRVAIAGGAQLFSFEGSESRLDVGKRNTEAVKSLLSIMRLKLVAEEVGGRSGRTVALNAATGEVTVKQAGGSSRVLAKLGS